MQNTLRSMLGPYTTSIWEEASARADVFTGRRVGGYLRGSAGREQAVMYAESALDDFCPADSGLADAWLAVLVGMERAAKREARTDSSSI